MRQQCCDVKHSHTSRGVEYKKIDDAGLHITVDGKERVLDVDNIVVCAGQSPLRYEGRCCHG